MRPFDPRVTRLVLTPRLDTNTEQEIRVSPATMETLCAMIGRSRYDRQEEAPSLSPAQAVLHALTSKTHAQILLSWSPEALERLLAADRELRTLLDNSLAGSGVTLIEATRGQDSD